MISTTWPSNWSHVAADFAFTVRCCWWSRCCPRYIQSTITHRNFDWICLSKPFPYLWVHRHIAFCLWLWFCSEACPKVFSLYPYSILLKWQVFAGTWIPSCSSLLIRQSGCLAVTWHWLQSSSKLAIIRQIWSKIKSWSRKWIEITCCFCERWLWPARIKTRTSSGFVFVKRLYICVANLLRLTLCKTLQNIVQQNNIGKIHFTLWAKPICSEHSTCQTYFVHRPSITAPYCSASSIACHISLL